LEETPSILRGLMRELNHEDAEWKPAPDRFSVADVLAHLSHSEGHCCRMRLDPFMSEEMPEFERTTRKCTSSSTAAPIPKIRSIISRTSARSTWNICGRCRTAPATAARIYEAAGGIAA